MSGTETILLVVLGFALASLIALFMGRMVWSTAVKIGARRMQRQVPSSLVGLQTERDRLRAEYAMLAQRLGARLEDSKLRLAESMAEVSRHRNRIHQMESGEHARSVELRQLRSRVQELELAVADGKSLEAELRQELAAKEETIAKLRRKSGYEGYKVPPSAAAPKPPEDPEIRLRQRIDRLSEMARATTTDEIDPLSLRPAPEPTIADRLAEAERQTHDLEADLRKLDAEWSEPSGPAADNVIPLPNRSRDHKTATN